MKTNLRFTRPLLLTLFALVSFQMTAQAIAMLPPISAGDENSRFKEICAGLDTGSGPFNSYDVTIKWGGTANPDNQFVLELSDANGDFTNAVELATSSTTEKVFDLNFSIPTDTRGDGYKFRARSTSPVSQAESDDAYPMYYMDITTNLNISELGDGVPPGSVCSATEVTLQVDNINNPQNYEYRWFKSLSPVPGETGHTITIGAGDSGTYQAYIYYGETCTFRANTDSNLVPVTIGGTGSGVNITTPSKTALCAGETETLNVEMPDSSADYKWFKDSIPIPGANTTSYTVDGNNPNFEGDYQVEISGDGICTELSPVVSITNAGAFTVTRDNSANIVVLPSQPETLSVSTTATMPATYQWYRNGAMVGGATNATLDITQDGTYYAAVTSSGACSSTVNSENTEAVVPSSFEVVIDFDSSYTACVSTNAIVEVAMINAVASDGSKSDVTGQLKTSFNYQWQRDGVDVAGATGQNISLANNTENGDYTVNATLGTYNETSNTLAVQLLTSETVTINSTSTVYCNSSDTITISTATDLTSETFSWERDGTSINTTDPSLVVTELGTYRLVLDKDGCPLPSNEIAITPLDPNLITLDVDGDIVFPEGSSETVTASGGTAYQWFDEGSNLLSSTDQMTFTQEGTFTLVANIDNCQITRQLTAVYLDLFNVPNVITPNGDGANDQWVIPNSYSNKSDVNVIIYNDKGVELVNETGYANNWPQSATAFPKQNMVFYYVIKNTTETLKQGTITVIR